MERYIPYEKMSKKQKKDWDSKQRTLWGGNPVTRKTENKKHYNRKKVQRIDKSDFTEPLSFYLGFQTVFMIKNCRQSFCTGAPRGSTAE